MPLVRRGPNLHCCRVGAKFWSYATGEEGAKFTLLQGGGKILKLRHWSEGAQIYVFAGWGQCESELVKLRRWWCAVLCCVWHCRQTEEINQALEDNQVKLSTMKASRFVNAFVQEVDKWERALSHIAEVIEMLLTVQRQWMYLEVYLCGYT